jgi:hypothetical protein
LASRRLRLCLDDLYRQDVIEMVERETRQFAVWEVSSPDDPDFREAFDLLWAEFGAHGEMEREDAIRRFLIDDPWEPEPSGAFVRYFLLVARGPDGAIRGVRDGSVLVHPFDEPDLCVVYLSHLVMRPEARGTVLSYWLRIAPVEVALGFLAGLHRRGLLTLPQPDRPGRWFGCRIDLCAEMEFFAPEDDRSLRRMLFYGRGGFDAIDPRHFPYLQPDFRAPDVVEATAWRPLPFLVLVRRMGREREARMPIAEASAIARRLYDDFACHCPEEDLEDNLGVLLDRLGKRKATHDHVDLLPLPTGPKDLMRFRPLLRRTAYERYYRGVTPVVEEYLAVAPTVDVGRYLQDLGASLAARPRDVYADRDKVGVDPE